MTVAFKSSVRVYYEDTDAAGVVYYANYLRFMERCRSDWLRTLGYDVQNVTRQYGIFFAVRSTRVEYYKPAKLSDLLTVTAQIQQLRRASLRVDQHIYRNEELICGGSIRLAAMNADAFQPARIPEPLIERIKTWKMP